MQPTPRLKLFNILLGEIPAMDPDPVIRVGIDGVDGAGKTVFATTLAQCLEKVGETVILASVDGFHNPRETRYAKGKDSPDGFFEDSYNYSALKSHLLDPLSDADNMKFRRSVFDVKADCERFAEQESAESPSILIVDGIFLHREELKDYWDFSIFLDVNFKISVARCAQRDGTNPDPDDSSNRRYVEGQKIYLSRCKPMDIATMVIDYNDINNPVITAERIGE
jgi:uridine kinase